MLKLTGKPFSSINQFFKDQARDLEKYLFEYYFQGGNGAKIIEALKKYQNNDGGFGNGLESDFRQPFSSPMATSIGVRLLSQIDGNKDAEEMIKSAIGYYESAFNETRNGWFAVTKDVNDYPHAPWWHYDEENGMTIIDRNWGNPSAEILSHLYKYKEYVSKLDIDYLVEYALKYIEAKERFESENELFCYIKLFEVLPDELKKRLMKRIAVGISQVIEYDREKWTGYVPMPLDFVPGPDKCRFGVGESKIEENLDFYVELVENNGVVNPPWGEGYYLGSLKPAYNEWKGVLTLNILRKLDAYGRMEKRDFS
ncbi:MAG: hypothetical protein HPY66_0143 [Firmicutes bacterium]|nr:hypothetical protein [Bacillota bacterium]